MAAGGASIVSRMGIIAILPEYNGFMRPQGILCCGNIAIDILVRPVEQFRWGTTTWVDSIEQNLGGNGSNTSYTLGKLGVPVRLLGMVGQDGFGERALAILRSAGVDLSFVGRSRAATCTSVCPVNAAGDRLFLHLVGSSAEVYPEPIEFTPAMLEGMSHFHLANVFALPAMRQSAPESLRSARKAGLTTSADTGWDARGRWLADIEECLPHLDLLFVNQDEARMLSGRADPDEAARRMQDLGATDVVIKLGADGCAVFTADGVLRLPGFAVDVVDTTGAGDCFVGGFLAALGAGAAYGEAARFANAVGALSVQKLGAINGVRTRAETEAWLRTLTAP
jgi:sugar/nucleoside kinase (ribokinase family)